MQALARVVRKNTPVPRDLLRAALGCYRIINTQHQQLIGSLHQQLQLKKQVVQLHAQVEQSHQQLQQRQQ